MRIRYFYYSYLILKKMNWKKALLGLPKSLWVNFRYLPLGQTIRLPIVVSPDCCVSCGGKVILRTGEVSFAMIRVGFHNVPSCNFKDETKIFIE